MSKIIEYGKVTIDFSGDHYRPEVLIENFGFEGCGNMKEAKLIVLAKVIKELSKLK